MLTIRQQSTMGYSKLIILYLDPDAIVKAARGAST